MGHIKVRSEKNCPCCCIISLYFYRWCFQRYAIWVRCFEIFAASTMLCQSGGFLRLLFSKLTNKKNLEAENKWKQCFFSATQETHWSHTFKGNLHNCTPSSLSPWKHTVINVKSLFSWWIWENANFHGKHTCLAEAFSGATSLIFGKMNFNKAGVLV